MSYMPNASPVFMYTNNADFTLTKNATTYMPSNLNSLYEGETSYDSSSNSLKSDKCVCVFDFWGSNTNSGDTNSYHYIDNENSVTMYGRNTSIYAGMGGRLDDSITAKGTDLTFRFVRGQYSSAGTVTIQQNRAFLAGVSLK